VRLSLARQNAAAEASMIASPSGFIASLTKLHQT